MQKIDFVKNLQAIHEKHKSNEIMAQFDAGFKQPGNPFNYGAINPLLFLSKSNYDQINDDNRYKQILEGLNAQSIYTEANLSYLTTIFRQTKAEHVIINPNAIALYNFHSTIVHTLNLSNTVLQTTILSNNLDNEGNNGVVVFQVIVEGEGLQTEQYIKIFSAINELTETIAKIVDETEQKSEIILLDSGSDSNIGIKSGIETAKSLFLIFKEIWDYITNFKYYKQKQKNEALLESLSIRTEIMKKVQEGVLTEKEGMEYLHMVKTRTDTLIGMKVLPKQIVAETSVIENKKLLNEFEGIKMLMSGETTTDH